MIGKKHNITKLKKGSVVHLTVESLDRAIESCIVGEGKVIFVSGSAALISDPYLNYVMGMQYKRGQVHLILNKE